MAAPASGGRGVALAKRSGAAFNLLVGGGSNAAGFLTGAPWLPFPAAFTYWTNKTGSLVNTGAWPTNPGIAHSLIDELRTLGHAGQINLVEWGVNGTSYSTWKTPAVGDADLAIAACATAGIRPQCVVEFLGSVDAGTPALAAAIQTNVQLTWERYRAAWGASLGIVQAGCQTPETGSYADLDLADLGMYTVANRHAYSTAHYVNMRAIAIQGSGSDHLTGQAPPAGITVDRPWTVQPAIATPGGADIAGRLLARVLHNSGIVP